MIKIAMKPFVCKRPRLGRGHTHNDPIYSRNKQELSLRLKSVSKDRTYFGPFRISLIFTFKTPAKPSHDHPTIGDIDNYVKAFMDAGNSVLFVDDKHCVELCALKRFGDEDSIQFEVESA
jgi:Holliday junction resolvase RusA-like endonuclease